MTLYVDGKEVGEGDIPMTQAMIFSANDGCDVDEDSGAAVSPDYGPQGNAFNGQVKGVQLAIAEAAEDADHLWDKYEPPFKFTGTLYGATVDVSGDLIKDDEHAMKVIMARQ